VSPHDDFEAARACALPAKWEVPLSRVRPLLERGLKARRKFDVSDFWYGRVQAQVWLRNERAEEALRELRQGLKDAPHLSPGLNHLTQALALKQLGRDADARQALKEAIAAGPPVHHPAEAMEYQLLLREARRALGGQQGLRTMKP